MRLIVFAVIGFLFAMPVWGQSVQNFGSYTCSQHVPCPDDPNVSNVATPETYAADGNACMREGFGYSNPAGYFDVTAGLDGSSCLVAVPGSVQKGSGAQLTPNCCVTKTGSICVFHCDLNAYQ